MEKTIINSCPTKTGWGWCLQGYLKFYTCLSTPGLGVSHQGNSVNFLWLLFRTQCYPSRHGVSFSVPHKHSMLRADHVKQDKVSFLGCLYLAYSFPVLLFSPFKNQCLALKKIIPPTCRYSSSFWMQIFEQPSSIEQMLLQCLCQWQVMSCHGLLEYHFISGRVIELSDFSIRLLWIPYFDHLTSKPLAVFSLTFYVM